MKDGDGLDQTSDCDSSSYARSSTTPAAALKTVTTAMPSARLVVLNGITSGPTLQINQPAIDALSSTLGGGAAPPAKP